MLVEPVMFANPGVFIFSMDWNGSIQPYEISILLLASRLLFIYILNLNGHYQNSLHDFEAVET